MWLLERASREQSMPLSALCSNCCEILADWQGAGNTWPGLKNHGVLVEITALWQQEGSGFLGVSVRGNVVCVFPVMDWWPVEAVFPVFTQCALDEAPAGNINNMVGFKANKEMDGWMITVACISNIIQLQNLNSLVNGSTLINTILKYSNRNRLMAAPREVSMIESVSVLSSPHL